MKPSIASATLLLLFPALMIQPQTEKPEDVPAAKTESPSSTDNLARVRQKPTIYPEARQHFSGQVAKEIQKHKACSGIQITATKENADYAGWRRAQLCGQETSQARRAGITKPRA